MQTDTCIVKHNNDIKREECGESILLYFTPSLTENTPLNSPFKTISFNPVWKCLVMVTSFSGHPYVSSVFHGVSRSIVSNVLKKSTNEKLLLLPCFL